MSSNKSRDGKHRSFVIGYVAASLGLLASNLKEFLSDQPDFSNPSLLLLTGLGISRIAASEAPGFDRSNPWLLRILMLGFLLPAVGTVIHNSLSATQRLIVAVLLATVATTVLWTFEMWTIKSMKTNSK